MDYLLNSIMTYPILLFGSIHGRDVIIVLNRCIFPGDESDRTYLRCCSIRAWIRLRSLKGETERWWLCSVTFHRLQMIVFN